MSEGLKVASRKWVVDKLTELYSGLSVILGSALKTGANRIYGYTKFDYRPTGGGTNSYGVQVRHNVGNTSGLVSSVDHEAHLVVNSTASIRGLQGVAVVDAGKTLTNGTLNGVYGQVRNDGAVAGAGFLAALYGIVEAGAAITASHVCSLWLDSHQANAVTGNHELLYMSNNGAASLDQVMYASGQAEAFFHLNAAGGPALNYVSDTATTAGASKKIKVLIDGNTFYLNVYAGS